MTTNLMDDYIKITKNFLKDFTKAFFAEKYKEAISNEYIEAYIETRIYNFGGEEHRFFYRRIYTNLIKKSKEIKENSPILDGQLIEDNLKMYQYVFYFDGVRGIQEPKAFIKEMCEKRTTKFGLIKITGLEDRIYKMAKKYDISIKQMEKFNNPSEDYIKKRIASVETVTNFAAVTEDNDPNGKLNKAGGYTSTVYFESSLVNQSEFDTNDVIEKGTECGGSIEVYSTEEDAKKRDTYLASFDGSILSNGKHTVVGTVVIRVSDEMGASKQEELTQKIKDAIAKLD